MHITNARICDPANLDRPTSSDLWIINGQIAPTPSQAASRTEVREIDATDCLVLPGAIDMHTHVLIPPTTALSGHYISPVDAQRQYSALGYTTIVEAAVTPEQVVDTHRQAQALPDIKSFFLLELGNNPHIIDCLDRHGVTKAIQVLQRMLADSKALGIKLVNPGRLPPTESPSAAELASIDSTIPNTTLTPRKVIEFFVEAHKALQLRTPITLHAPQVGVPGNVESTIQTLEAFGPCPVHLAHAQFYAYGCDREGRHTSAAEMLAEYIATSPCRTTDAGPIIFGNTPVYTADTALNTRLDVSTHAPNITYRSDNPINAIQWATALELLLTCRDPWRMAISLDHPNAGPIWAYPQVFALLADRDLRNQQLAAMHPAATVSTNLINIDRQYTIEDITIATRAGPARILDLPNKGHLGPGADADIVIYRDDLTDIQDVLAKPRYVIKNGKVILTDDQAHEQNNTL